MTVPPLTSGAYRPRVGNAALKWQPETNKGVTRDASDPNPEADQADDRV
jgi:hypothetical protein